MIREELLKAAEQGFREEEIARAKAQLKAGLLAGLESSSARAEQMARQVLIHGRPLTTPELIEEVEQVQASDLQAWLLRFLPPRSALPRLGPFFMLQDSSGWRKNSRFRRARPLEGGLQTMALLRAASCERPRAGT